MINRSGLVCLGVSGAFFIAGVSYSSISDRTLVWKGFVLWSYGRNWHRRACGFQELRCQIEHQPDRLRLAAVKLRDVRALQDLQIRFADVWLKLLTHLLIAEPCLRQHEQAI